MSTIALSQEFIYTNFFITIKEVSGMKPNDVLTFYGTQYRFGKETGMSPNTLGNWLKWGFIPEDSQYRLERITKGALKTEWSDNKITLSELKDSMNWP